MQFYIAVSLKLITILVMVVVILKYKKYGICHPYVIVSVSYMVLIVFGEIFYTYVKGRYYDHYAESLTYIGFISMFLGTFVAKYRVILSSLKNRGVYVFAGAKSNYCIYFVAAIGVMAFLVLVLFSGVPIISDNVNEARIRFFSGKGYLNVFFISLQIVPLAILFDVFARKMYSRIIWCHLFSVVVFFLNIATGFRGIAIKSILLYFLTYLFISNKKLSLAKGAVVLLALLLFLSVVGAFRREGKVGIEGVAREIGITLVARPAIFETIVKKFDVSSRFNGIGYVYDFLKFKPGEQKGKNVELKYMFFKNYKNMPESAGINPSIIGEAYVNFGVSGVFIIPFIVGFIVRRLYMRCYDNFTFFNVVLYVSVVLEVSLALASGLGPRLPMYSLVLFWICLISLFYSKRIVIKGDL
ncbi:hypothetical protein C2E25_08285 [Geothermobacter hydrogeniphilus]|uniref:Oligosaccharide repeat unit polymerase n=1 Tax=Geothermobacter hydrogeniphilus TaxID=1969733 RepID=A0A2K2HAF9_9BACT|nr:O-antigen polymerase [Geothermobacter hydrogeniphilus]PNU20294.1 hypothetical protein C2E25_08285 [Geothermobacter hydrogeniphilus]